MINFKCVNDINVIKNGSQNKKVLFKIKGEKEKNKNNIRMPLNISLVLDVSSSMSESIGFKSITKNNTNNDATSFLMGINSNNQRNVGFIGGLLENQLNTKMNQVKDAAIKCIELLEEGDFVSIVIFNENAKLVNESVKINDSIRNILKNKINDINEGGGTNLHAGWLQGGIEVAKNLSKKSINRILILTDGETNQGITNSVEINKHVEGLANTGISTSTFGVGDHYNEDLLEKMATVSGGNFYYIEDESRVESILREEFNCLNNIVADNAKISFKTNHNVNIKCLNELDYADNKYIIGNLVRDKEINILIEFSFKNKNNIDTEFNLGEINLEFIDTEGNTGNLTIKLDYKTVSEKDFNIIQYNEEVNIQNVILEMAKNQKLAKEAIKNGEREIAINYMKNSIKDSKEFIFDSRVKREIDGMNTFMNQSSSYSDGKMSKMLSSMSYYTRTSKNK